MKLLPARCSSPADPGPRTWAIRLALAGALFIAVGIAVVLAGLALDPRRNADVLCAGVTLAVAGGVLRSIASPADHIS
jgi:hypothetical protein